MANADLLSNGVARFLDRLASGDPTPGGGSAAALAGALAAGLVSMVCNLTLGREKYRASESDVHAIHERAEQLRGRLQSGIAADAAAYDGVMAAYRLPRGSDEERDRRADKIQSATMEATRVPLEIGTDAAAVLELARAAVPITNPNAASDLTVAGLLATAAARGAIANAEMNLATLRDDTFLHEARDEIRRLLDALGASGGRAS
jgi:methenyltetrahydrofolate cyclohydrolase